MSLWFALASSVLLAWFTFPIRMHREPGRLPPLDLLVAFEAVARLGSVTHAAAERFVTQSAMSRQIRALEDDLGHALFLRRHRALQLTDAGMQLLRTVTPVLAQLRQTVAQIRAPSVREVLALTTTPGFAALWLVPRLASFTREQPGIDVRMDASFAARDLGRDGFDLAVRYGPVARTPGQMLFSETVVPVCSPHLFKRGAPSLRDPTDLSGHTLLQMAPDKAGLMPLDWDLWLQSVGAAPVQPKARLTFSQYNETITAALAGQGIALGKRPLVNALLKSGRLIAPLEEVDATRRGFFLIVHPDAAKRPSVQAFAQWLMQQAAASTRERRKGTASVP
jgi:LysR family glycine cleavage system transcriptional activator